jgi:hypothetical protein
LAGLDARPIEDFLTGVETLHTINIPDKKQESACQKDWIKEWGHSTLTRHDGVQEPEQLAGYRFERMIRRIQIEVTDWVGRGYGRRMPPGISRLLKRIAKDRDEYPLGG